MVQRTRALTNMIRSTDDVFSLMLPGMLPGSQLAMLSIMGQTCIQCNVHTHKPMLCVKFLIFTKTGQKFCSTFHMVADVLSLLRPC